MVKMVLFSPGSVRRPYTNTGFSENVKTFQVSPSFVLYLHTKKRRLGEVPGACPACCRALPAIPSTRGKCA